MLDQRTKRVAVGRDQNGLATLEVADNLVVPEREHALEHILEAFSLWHVRAEVCIALVVRLRELVGVVDRRWWHIEASTPGLKLLGPVLGEGLGLVFAL